ncbi:MAG TPA: pentapeptide repeat-containing protein [Solirubrobacterales bacterium]|nr:pentapeptide repeat-containing protein [Solirubrobacterales bacterium]
MSAALALVPASAFGEASEAPKLNAERELAEAEVEKTKAETKKLQDDDSVFWRALSTFGPLLTALIAAGGLLASVKKAGDDRRDAFDREAEERQVEAGKRAEAEQAAETTRFDERFAKAVEGLSSANAGEQNGAAVLVASMVREKRAALSDQALQLLLVSLQAPHDEACERLLRAALQKFAHAAPRRLVTDGEGDSVGGLTHIRTSYLKLPYLKLPGLDLAFARLRKAEFRGADLTGCFAYETKLEEADFRNADLTGARWVKAEAPHARFQKASLARARLHKATLSHANFYEADLTKANLRQAVLIGADFRKAKLERADFHGAIFDEKALRSILDSIDWNEAEFDQSTQQALHRLAEAP